MPPAPERASRSNAARSAGTRRSKPCCRSATCRRSTRWCRSAQVPRQQPWFPTDLLYCGKCELVQLGLAVDPVIIFPPEYPYTSGTTKLLRDNFADLCAESGAMLKLTPQDLVIDIGSNDGTLLSNFQKAGYRVLGIEPTEVGKIAAGRGIPTAHALLHAGGGGGGEARARAGAGRDGGELLCAHRGRACHRRGHSRSARARTGCSFRNRTISSGCSIPSSTTPSITSICATIRSRASRICWECTGSRCFTPGRSRRTAARSASMRRGAASCR